MHTETQSRGQAETARDRAQRDTGRERTELERQRQPQGQRARAPRPRPTHVLEERVSGGPGGGSQGRRGPPGLGRGRPDQAHGEQPRTRHGAATHSATARSAAAPASGRRRRRRRLGLGGPPAHWRRRGRPWPRPPRDSTPPLPAPRPAGHGGAPPSPRRGPRFPDGKSQLQPSGGQELHVVELQHLSPPRFCYQSLPEGWQLWSQEPPGGHFQLGLAVRVPGGLGVLHSRGQNGRGRTTCPPRAGPTPL